MGSLGIAMGSIGIFLRTYNIYITSLGIAMGSIGIFLCIHTYTMGSLGIAMVQITSRTGQLHDEDVDDDKEHCDDTRALPHCGRALMTMTMKTMRLRMKTSVLF